MQAILRPVPPPVDFSFLFRFSFRFYYKLWVECNMQKVFILVCSDIGKKWLLYPFWFSSESKTKNQTGSRNRPWICLCLGQCKHTINVIVYRILGRYERRTAREVHGWGGPGAGTGGRGHHHRTGGEGARDVPASRSGPRHYPGHHPRGGALRDDKNSYNTWQT